MRDFGGRPLARRRSGKRFRGVASRCCIAAEVGIAESSRVANDRVFLPTLWPTDARSRELGRQTRHLQAMRRRRDRSKLEIKYAISARDSRSRFYSSSTSTHSDKVRAQ